MVAPSSLFVIVTCYVLLLFALAYYAEKRERVGRSIVNNPYVYALSLAVYCTSWTFYGSVGRAATSGLSFLAVYLGPTIMVALWPFLLKKIITTAKANKITTISDFIGFRYGKSLSLSVLVTLIAIVGLVPYIGLQLKAITNTFIIISGKTLWSGAAGISVAALLAVFTILFGARRLDLSERHGGLVFAIAFESLVKLASLLLIGLFVTYGLFGGFQDIFDKILLSGHSELLFLGPGSDTSYSEWFALIFLSMTAVLFLPRQFHLAVVENYDEAHVKKAVWLFPLYLLLINIFVLPLAFGGLLLNNGGSGADYYVLTLPLQHGEKWLAVIAFLGGFSAATGMVIVESLALSAMVMNSVIMPVLFKFQDVPKFSWVLLTIRRVVILGIIFLAYLFTSMVGPLEGLVETGLKSFEAVSLFAPSFILGLYWKRGNKAGAMAGLLAGFLVWFYTVIVPVMMQAGTIDSAGIIGVMTGSEMLNPYNLFGVGGLGKWGHSLFWSLLFNIAFYMGVSAFTRQSGKEEVQSLLFVQSYEAKGLSRGSYAFGDIENILSQYLERTAVKDAADAFLSRKKKKKDELSAKDLSEWRDEAEKSLSGAVGPSMASIIFEDRFVLTESERRQISESLKNYTERLRLSHRELAEANNELRVRAEALQKAHDELEARVKKRTSELSVANEQLHQRHLEASVLYKVSSVISHSIQMDKLLGEVLRTISELGVFTIDKGGIFVVEGDNMKLMAHLGHSETFLALHKGMKVGDCLCGRVAKTGKIMISANSAKDSRHTIVDPDASAHGHLIIPLKTKDRVEGVLDLYMPADVEVDADKVALLRSIGDQLGIAIENARLYERTKELSLHDSLTGLWNHEEILRILKQELTRAEREHLCVGVIMADLDYFKEINDTYGHPAGDEVLRAIAGRMLASMRHYDSIGRYGGEEFMIVLPGGDENRTADIAERLRRSIADKGVDTSAGTIQVTASLGAAVSGREQGLDMKALVHVADAALYRAKKKGRNRLEFASDDIINGERVQK